MFVRGYVGLGIGGGGYTVLRYGNKGGGYGVLRLRCLQAIPLEAPVVKWLRVGEHIVQSSGSRLG